MTNLNGGHSVIMIPPKKSSVDDYAPNPLLLPPSPSAARFIASSNITAPTLSSSPLRPALHTVASSSSLSSSFGSMSGTTTTSQTNGGTVSNGGAAAHGHQPINSGTTLPAQVSSALSSSIPTTTSSSPSSLPLVTNSNNTGTNSAATANNNNNSNAMSSSCATPTVIGSTNPKSVMNVTAPSYYQNTAFANNAMNSSNVSVNIQSHNVPITSTTMTNGSQQLHHHHLQNNNAHFLTQQTQAQQHPSIPMHMLIVPPEPRSLHLDALRKDDDLMEELQMTVHDLSQWLEVFETGIKSIRSS
ncbi:hypothetical protein BCR41DRAFT_375212 [Lobosporangium transversale]|uniref:Uncharacterized protein n=1 Tax=Lobosporangium transversale TaxID=64571 RepID=A0A1Y2G7P2_9FUNG|nr:hypothetical protein BCR41DRAFT_375212 [Lobosporangium transversale]ORZ01814.1 hypothetical protein BCR41DRAFT_375212 [Lobosporangium transversale]|eukprot:XP_021876111.1 hypothetical protein BCR41DRAFT_375212 [Lobosporangium transversale]